MNFLQFEKCFDALAKDERLSMAHLCIYTALFQCWNKNGFVNPVRITRKEIMKRSKIRAKTTYHKCINELRLAGYIKYEPSYQPVGSFVYIIACKAD